MLWGATEHVTAALARLRRKMSAVLRSGNWGDLLPRLLSAIVMVAIAVFTIREGGLWFQGLAVVVTGLMFWELTRMIEPARAGRAIVLGVIAALAQVAVIYGGAGAPFIIFVAVALFAGMVSIRDKWIVSFYGLFVLFAPWGFVYFREAGSVHQLAWVLVVIVVTDILGYFAGRFFGGPKFWPKVSPKKTWSGTLAGWVGAALVGAGYVFYFDVAPVFVLFSVLLSFAGQMGDIAESAIKRRAGIKDSSNLIPGHGGLLDRFDAMIAASSVLLILLWAHSFVAA